jgi:uncharacterized protein (DUF697 family)
VGLLTNIIPPVAAFLLALDIGAISALQAAMIYKIAAIYGFSTDDAERRGEVLAIWAVFTGSSGTLKSGLSFFELLPGVGTAIGVSSDAAIIYGVGFLACRYYEVKVKATGHRLRTVSFCLGMYGVAVAATVSRRAASSPQGCQMPGAEQAIVQAKGNGPQNHHQSVQRDLDGFIACLLPSTHTAQDVGNVAPTVMQQQASGDRSPIAATTDDSNWAIAGHLVQPFGQFSTRNKCRMLDMTAMPFPLLAHIQNPQVIISLYLRL